MVNSVGEKYILVLIATVLLLISTDALARQAKSQLIKLTGHVPVAQIAHATHVGRLDSSQTMGLLVSLNKIDSGLEDLIRRQQTPGDALYGKFLTPAEFRNRFAPADEDIASVTDYLTNQGLSVSKIHDNGLFVTVEGTVAQIESAFAIQMHQYKTANGRLVYAPIQDPSVDSKIAPLIQGVIGLNNFAERQVHYRQMKNVIKPSNFTGSGPNGYLMASDIRKAYNANLSQTGAGQSIALFELDGYFASDMSMYATANGMSLPTISKVLIDGFNGAPTNADVVGEVTLDIQMAMAMAPGAKIIVYEGAGGLQGTSQQWLDVFLRIASDNLAKQVSTSYGSLESSSDPQVVSGENTIFQQMASQGQSLFAASGDSGAYDQGTGGAGSTLALQDPSSQPYIVAVGGTTLSLNADGTYAQESAWGSIDDAGTGRPGGGGGGISTLWPIPAWQSGVSMTSNSGSTTRRNTPDISLNADLATGYEVALNGQFQIIGGTSAAAPLWASFTALVNQQRVSQSMASVGFLNPALYLIGGSSLYASCFQDVTGGSNFYYFAVPSFDLATGWGSLNGAGLLGALANAILPSSPPTNLTVKIVKSTP